MEDFEEKEIDLRKYFSIVYKRRWTILAVFGVFLFFGVLITLRADPVYQSKARILIEKGSTDVSIEDIIAGAASPYSRDYFPTQYKIISSRAVAKKVIKNLNLENSTEFFPPEKDDFISNMIGGVKNFVGSIKSFLAGLLKKSKEEPTGESSVEPDIDPRLVSAFIDRVDVKQVEDSKLVDVAVEAKNPAMAAKMANALVDAYIEHTLETKLESAKDAVKWLGDRIDEERDKVEEAENRLLRYKEEHGILTEFSDDAESINAEKLARLEEQVVEAEAKRVEAQTRYSQASALEGTHDQVDSISEVLSNQIIQEIKKMEVELYNRRSELSKKYGSNHPQMVAIRSELDELRKRKVQEVKQIVNSLRNEYKLAVAREESLKAALAEEKAKTLAMNQKAIQYSVLKRQAESSRQLYDMLIKRFKETSLTEEMKGGNVRVIDHAEVPRTPIKPNKKRNILLAAVLGLMLGTGLAFFLEYLDNTLKLPEEISEYLGIPFLGAVPAFEKEAQKKRGGEAGADRAERSQIHRQRVVPRCSHGDSVFLARKGAYRHPGFQFRSHGGKDPVRRQSGHHHGAERQPRHHLGLRHAASADASAFRNRQANRAFQLPCGFRRREGCHISDSRGKPPPCAGRPDSAQSLGNSGVPAHGRFHSCPEDQVRPRDHRLSTGFRRDRRRHSLSKSRWHSSCGARRRNPEADGTGGACQAQGGQRARSRRRAQRRENRSRRLLLSILLL